MTGKCCTSNTAVHIIFSQSPHGQFPYACSQSLESRALNPSDFLMSRSPQHLQNTERTGEQAINTGWMESNRGRFSDTTLGENSSVGQAAYRLCCQSVVSFEVLRHSWYRRPKPITYKTLQTIPDSDNAGHSPGCSAKVVSFEFPPPTVENTLQNSIWWKLYLV